MNYCRAKISCEQTRLSAAAFVPENLLVSSTPAMPTPPMDTCKRSWRKAMAASIRAADSKRNQRLGRRLDFFFSTQPLRFFKKCRMPAALTVVVPLSSRQTTRNEIVTLGEWQIEMVRPMPNFVSSSNNDSPKLHINEQTMVRARLI
ncbi:hypothetical protein [Agrobacterium pusense]|uniref:hypothetical protein n=1 Tax=Agrobacterium pusense TaxID=648995 RepID=UPI002FDD2DC8